MNSPKKNETQFEMCDWCISVRCKNEIEKSSMFRSLSLSLTQSQQWTTAIHGEQKKKKTRHIVDICKTYWISALTMLLHAYCNWHLFLFPLPKWSEYDCFFFLRCLMLLFFFVSFQFCVVVFDFKCLVKCVWWVKCMRKKHAKKIEIIIIFQFKLCSSRFICRFSISLQNDSRILWWFFF